VEGRWIGVCSLEQSKRRRYEGRPDWKEFCEADLLRLIHALTRKADPPTSLWDIRIVLVVYSVFDVACG